MAPKKTNKLPTGERPKQLSKTATTIKKAAANPSRASGLKAEKITPREAARRAGVVRDRFNRQTNTAVFNKTTPTVYSPKPMSDAAKRKASRAGEAKDRTYRDMAPIEKMPYGPARTSYSPRKMTKYDEGKAAARGKATAKKTAPKSTVSKVVKRAKTVAREGRDVVTAVGTLATGTKRNIKGNLYSDKYTPVKNLAKQIKEVGTAAVKGKKGTTSTKITPGLIIPGNKRRK
jgi:hypothetical protein